MSARATYHHGDLPKALQAEALRRIREEGVHSFSLRSAARAVGVDVAAVYRHYANREALLRAVAREGFVALAAAMAVDRERADSPEGRLRAVGRAYVRFARSEPQLFRLMFGPFGAGSGQPLFDDGSSVAFSALTDALADLDRAGGCTRSIADAGLAAWSAVHGFATLLVDGPLGGDDAGSRLEVVLDVVIAGLKGAGPPAHP